VCQDRCHQFARDVSRQQPVAVLGEHRRHPHRLVDAETNEPTEQQIVLQLFHQLAFGADREQDLDQRRTQQALRRDGWAAVTRVKSAKIGVQAGQRGINHGLDLAQRMPCRHALFEVHVAEQRAVLLI
jgi:hypothetical protein